MVCSNPIPECEASREKAFQVIPEPSRVQIDTLDMLG
jgi:hypothetical protein